MIKNKITKERETINKWNNKSNSVNGKRELKIKAKIDQVYDKIFVFNLPKNNTIYKYDFY